VPLVAFQSQYVIVLEMRITLFPVAPKGLARNRTPNGWPFQPPLGHNMSTMTFNVTIGAFLLRARTCAFSAAARS
jgi:hypothetical protein